MHIGLALTLSFKKVVQVLMEYARLIQVVRLIIRGMMQCLIPAALNLTLTHSLGPSPAVPIPCPRIMLWRSLCDAHDVRQGIVWRQAAGTAGLDPS